MTLAFNTMVRIALLSAALAMAGAAAAQVSPFAVGDGDAADAAGRSEAPSIPAPRRAGPTPPPAPAPAVRRAPPRTGVASDVPPPFDIDGDGRAPVVVLPEEERRFFRPSTTVSPLSDGRDPAPVMPVDVGSRRERAALTRLLRREPDRVRELRVRLGGGREWAEALVDRPIVPFRTMRLDGEIDTAAWRFFVSGAEAARGGTLSIAFTNSVLVLPEASRLRVFLNGRQIAETAIDSPDRTKVIALPISSDVLRPGENAIRLEALTHHRIDCSLDATFELWTRIDTRLTGLTFNGGRPPLAGLNDLPAVGVGTNGATRLRVLTGAPSRVASIDRMLRAVQAATLRGRFAQPLVEVVELGATAQQAPGTLNIAIGTASQVGRILPDLPDEARTGALTTLVDNGRLGPTVVITGPDEQAVDLALARFDAPASAAVGRTSEAIGQSPAAGEAAMIHGEGSVSLREAGVETVDFAGRRFSTRFEIVLPPDFYAAAYGEARLLLDAAYSPEVKPGSRLAVLVNGVPATSISFTSRSGEVFEAFPITLPMRSFRPGVNRLTIVADLLTESDEICLPGGTVPARERFALFSSTRLVFPPFARVGRVPELASFAADGFPYGREGAPVRVRVSGTSLDAVGAAGTLVSRVAASRGVPLRTAAVETLRGAADGGAIVVAPVQDLTPATVSATGAAGLVPSGWRQPFANDGTASGPEGLERYDAVLRRLREQLSQEDAGANGSDAATTGNGNGEADGGPPRTGQRWFETLRQDDGLGGLLTGALRLVRSAVALDLSLGWSTDAALDAPAIPETATLLLTQAPAPANDRAAWTLVTAPSGALLSTSLAAVTAPEAWTRIGGQATAYDPEGNMVLALPASAVTYVATAPPSMRNFRLIIANWFSLHNGVYALALVAAAMLLGVVTLALLRRAGRDA